MKERLGKGEKVVGAWMGTAEPQLVEMMGCLGFDFAVLDPIRTPMGVQQIAELLRAGEVTRLPLLVRSPVSERGLILSALEAGACGIILSRVETKKEVSAMVRAIKFPPEGERGCYPWMGARGFREPPLNLDDCVRRNSSITLWALIETKKGIENLEDIASIDELDGLVFDYDEYALQTGQLNRTRSRDVLQIKNRVISASKHNNKWTWLTPVLIEGEEAKIEAASDVICLPPDIQLIRKYFIQFLEQAKASLAELDFRAKGEEKHSPSHHGRSKA